MIGTGFYTCESCEDITWTTSEGVACWCCGRCVGVETEGFAWQNPCSWNATTRNPLPASA